jgi:hypothetical protein
MTVACNNWSRKGGFWIGLLLLYRILLLRVGVHAQIEKNYIFADLESCALSTTELAALGPEDELEPCIVFEIIPVAPLIEQDVHNTTLSSSLITMVQVTPSNCNNHRDGPTTAINFLNADNDGRGVAIGFKEDHYVQFHFVSAVAGNPANLSEDEYARRHDQILKSLLNETRAPYIVGSCSFSSDQDKGPALEYQAMVLSQVGPPAFYKDKNPYVFGFHINSDTYPLPNVQELGFLASNLPGGPASIPVRVIYRTKSEFFHSTCRSAINKLTEGGFTDLVEILYDHAADDDLDGDTNQFDEDFLNALADQACPPGSDLVDGFHPALFLCTLTEQDVILRRFIENGCRPVSLWVTAATWGWADSNTDLVPYFQGGAQWHEAFTYSDSYFETGVDLLLYNAKVFGYHGSYDQLVSYSIPVLYSQHLKASYRVEDSPTPLADFASPEGRERLRRAMVVLNVETIFGPVSFDEDQRNIGRGAAGTQWQPERSTISSTTAKYNEEEGKVFKNVLVSPLLQAEASTVIPAASSLPCKAGSFVNQTTWVSERSLLLSGCAACPVDFFTAKESQVSHCNACPPKSSTESSLGQTVCFAEQDNLLSRGLIAFGYVCVAIVWSLSMFFMGWLIRNRNDPVVKVAQIEFLMAVCVGTMISSSTIIALSFQAGTNEDTSMATAGCTAAPFLYSVGWVIQYGSLSAKTYRLFRIMENNKNMKRVKVTSLQMSTIVVAAMTIDLIIIITWTIVSPLVVSAFAYCIYLGWCFFARDDLRLTFAVPCIFLCFFS